MDRKDFLKVCGGACLGVIGLSAILQSCKTSEIIQGTLINQKVQIDKTEFLKENKKSFRRNIIVKPSDWNFPLVVYRKNDKEYTALLLKCTHQGNELNVSGDLLTCSAHGSEFSNTGEVIQGPAETKLKEYKVITDEKYIYIEIQ
jgi:Rieske Fe-S protein